MIDINRLIEADIARIEDEKLKREESERKRQRLDEEFMRTEARERLMHFFGGAAIDLGVFSLVGENEYEATVACYKFRIRHTGKLAPNTWAITILSSFGEWEPVERVADLKRLQDQRTID